MAVGENSANESLAIEIDASLPHSSSAPASSVITDITESSISSENAALVTETD